jgi:hypothetical protein
MARSKINKKNKPNIFAAQNKQISFDTNDELHFLSSPSYNGYSPTIGPSPSLEQQQEELASITKHHIPSFEERVPGAIFEENNTKKHPELQYTPNHSSSQPIQSSQPQQQSSEQQQQTVEQPSSQPVPVPTNMVIDETNLQNKGRTNTEEETSRSMEQLESLSFGKVS